MFETNLPLPDQYEGIDTVAVGGFPRDLYMGRERSDVDLMVTGVTPEDMKSRGFKHIMSADDRKPVFVDDLKREVAIARTEKSTGKGHNEFDMDIVDPKISHEEALIRDLKRRDLTMNAIAVDVRTGEVFDPFDGRSDIDDGIIRHVSSAFREDPLRVVRSARYAARFGFDIHEDTRELMSEISDDVSELTRGRLGVELIKVMKQSQNPRRFFDVLKNNDALQNSYPRISKLAEVHAGSDEYDRQNTSYEHSMRMLTEMFDRRGNDIPALLAALTHNIGKIDNSENKGRSSRIATEMRTELQLNRDMMGVISTSVEIHDNLDQLNKLDVTTLLCIADRVSNSPLSVEQVRVLLESNFQAQVSSIDNNSEEIASSLQEALDVIESIGGHEALENRGLTKGDIGNEVSGIQVGKFIRQDRKEELQSRLY